MQSLKVRTCIKNKLLAHKDFFCIEGHTIVTAVDIQRQVCKGIQRGQSKGIAQTPVETIIGKILGLIISPRSEDEISVHNAALNFFY